MNVHKQDDFVQIATIIGDTSRAIILNSLLDGRVLTARELSLKAKITPQTASSHLTKLIDSGLVTAESRGRFKYFKLANADVAHALESLLVIAPPTKVRSLRQSDQLKSIRYARTCYDHLAGELGVSLTRSMVKMEYLLEQEQEYGITESGVHFVSKLGIDIHEVEKKGRKRYFTRKCLDWSERKYHLGGALGAAITQRFFELKWIERKPETRAVTLTPYGKDEIIRHYGMELEG